MDNMKKLIGLICLVGLICIVDTASAQVKKADLAGSWYPSGRKELSAMLDSYLKAAAIPDIDGQIVAIISPHAGFVYSGSVAAYGYKALSRHKPGTVIILGISHRKYFDGISVYKNGEFQTPLGSLKVDEDVASAIINKDKRLSFYPEVFKDENSIETQLPFIKHALIGTQIVPIIFGSSNYEDCKILANALSEIISSRKAIAVIASTDMSHFKNYQQAKTIDAQTIEFIEQFKYTDIYKQGVSREQPCCGYMPVTCVLMLAEKIGACSVEVLKYANSGDTAGNYDRVVGYLSAAIVIKKPEHRNQSTEKKGKEDLMEDKGMLNENQRQRLLRIARESIAGFLKNGKKITFEEDDPLLNKSLGAFVTLHKNGQLRGCIGNIIGQGPLYKTIAAMAIESAVGDPRFGPLSIAELEEVDIEVSVLSELKRVKDVSQIRIPGHGVLVRKGYRSGVYLPQVATEAGWGKEQFLTSLCGQKAGLSPDAWKQPDTEIYIFTAEVFGEKE